jgi:glycosyltransferase involved in cell wall biosynthesis
MHVSICVCTYNRASILSYCLNALAKLNIPTGWDVEILVIDNNSTDDTKGVVEDAAQQSPIKILYFHESRQGLSAARNRAINESCGAYLGFLDDECVVQSDWLEIMAADIEEFSPSVIGGPYVGAFLPGTNPKWFKTEYGNAYFVAKQYRRGFQEDFRASGGNLVVHRQVCEVQQFDENYGMKGNELKLGEEILLQERFLSENTDSMVFYEPRMEVAHYILPQKMSLSYRIRRVMEVASSHYNIGVAALCIELTGAIAFLSISPLRAVLRDRRVYPYWQNYAYERVIPRVIPAFGAAIEKFRRRYR